MRFVLTAALCAVVAASGPLAPPHALAQAPSAYSSSGEASFDSWRDAFTQKAIESGRDPATVRRLLTGLTPDERAVANDRNQAEFVRPVWDYVTRAASATRITEGTNRRATHAATLSAIYERFGVDTDIIIGIWGMETNFGAAPLPHDAAQAIATLAWEGRRRAQFEAYLLALIEMVERGYAGPDQLRSSWAGALGQPQFMPDVYLSTAVDWNGDGRRDIWTDTGDVFASIANYLASREWRSGEPVFEEVRLPQGFDYALADGTRRSVTDWTALGVARADAGPWSATDTQLPAALFLPAGAEGPALLLFNNFGVIRTYNASDRYAMAVSLIARGVKGQRGLSQAWPVHLGSLQKDQLVRLQTALAQLGYSPGAADGMFGANTRRAVRQFQQAEGLPADGYPTETLLSRVVAKIGGFSEAAAVNTSPAPNPRAALSSDGVRRLQAALIKLGHLKGKPDGKMGRFTADAIRAFERRIGVTPTGEATDFILTKAEAAASRVRPVAKKKPKR
jgi:membrane-bound lytic murein transglycosylase B